MICYFIFSGRFNSKVGGHYQSIKSISSGISRIYPVKVFILGDSFVDIYSEAGIQVEFIPVKLFNIVSSFRHLIKKLKVTDVRYLHAFDSHSYFFVRILSYFLGIPCALTKCGGPNSKLLPICVNTIYFSKENKSYYENSAYYRHVNKTLLPNRVLPVAINLSQVKDLDIQLDPKEIKFLRINRICTYYKKVMTDSVRLVEYLNSVGIRCTLHIIGKVTEPQVLESLERSEYVKFYTSPEFYTNASELIPLFDVVVGTGRSAMESMAYGKFTLAPIKNGRYPIPVTSDNFHSFLNMNFSERMELEGYNEVSFLNSMKSLNWNLAIVRNDSATLFEEYLNIYSILGDYQKLYSATNMKRRIFPLDFLKHAAIFFGKLLNDCVRKTKI